MVCTYLLAAFSFLTRNRRVVILEGLRGQEELEGEKGAQI